MKIGSSAFPSVSVTSMRSGWWMPGRTAFWYSQARGSSRFSWPHASALTRRSSAAAYRGSSTSTRNPSPRSWMSRSVRIPESSNVDTLRMAASASSRAETGSDRRRFIAAASSRTSNSMWSSVFSGISLGRNFDAAERSGSHAHDLRLVQPALHRLLSREEPCHHDRREHQDDVRHQRSLESDGVGDGAVDRDADGPGHEPKYHDEPRGQACPGRHQLLSHQEHEGRR